MVVTFRKLVEQRVVTWDAVRRGRVRVPGTTMALGRGDMPPHDLVQFVLEGALGIDRGFWGSVAAGATFKSTGRRRTKPGRAVIVAHKAARVEAEGVVNDHHARWLRGEPTPVAAALDDARRRWAALEDGGTLTMEWPPSR